MQFIDDITGGKIKTQYQKMLSTQHPAEHPVVYPSVCLDDQELQLAATAQRYETVLC